MRIVAVQTGLNPKSVLGGTITDREFLTRLADRGAEVHVVAEAGEPVVEHRNFVVHHWRRRIRKRVPYVGNVDVAIDLRRLLRRIGPVDWVRFNSPYSVGMGTVASANGHRIWGSYLHIENFPTWRVIDRILPRYCDLITCLSADTRRDLVARCPRADHAGTIVVPMGIDTRRFETVQRSRADVRAALGIGPDDVVILFVGVLIPRKGIADLVAAWRMLGARPGGRLLMIAKPSAPQETQMVRELAQDDARVTHLEGVPYEQIPEYFRASDVFFFPSHLEGYGIVVGEAMASGLPVVTTRAQGIREVIADGETALTAEVGEVRTLAAHLDRLLGDPALRRRLGDAGRRRIATCFAWDAIMDRLVHALEHPPATRPR
ncbi:MAG: glycosyltransferase family 4 protein [Gemmatimonadaceae bacterium]|nr:glycosyltransferase family 4 protein [Gemmatimonadaceae bacterium]